MAHDALAQSGIDIGLSGEADYDAVYAAVTATERGRRFLTELESRNRRADTDALMAAIARVEAAVRSDAPSKQSNRPPDFSSAAGRLADIAIGLRERGADATLCDALDAAVRDVCSACGSETRNQQTKIVAAAEPDVAGQPRQAVGDAADPDSPTSGEAFDLPLQDTTKFAAAAAALAASLTALSEEVVQAESEPQSSSSISAAIPPHDFSAVAAPPPAAAAQGPRWHIEAPDFVFHQPQREAGDRTVEPAVRSSRPRARLPGLQLLPSPDEDPAELFEPSPKRAAAPPVSASTPSVARPAALASAISAAAQAVHTAKSPLPPRSETAPAVRAVPPRPAPVSPLAALRGLTEEELIALFG